MDTLKEIKNLITYFQDELKSNINTGVLTHIERAELYFKMAQSKNDEQFFTDVIYRSNQAYEGILKEAYRSFENKDPRKKRPAEIEDYFGKKELFNARVKLAFQSYRQQWRNPSTHDHQLFFRKEEAFLALLNVSAFILILLSQIIENQSYKEAKSTYENEDHKITIKRNRNENLNELIGRSLINFHNFENFEIANESQLIGVLKAYLETAFPNFRFISEPNIEDLNIFPDLVVYKGNQPITVIEVKRHFQELRIETGLKQLNSYLSKLNINSGILYFFPITKDVTQTLARENTAEKSIVVIKPKK